MDTKAVGRGSRRSTPTTGPFPTSALTGPVSVLLAFPTKPVEAQHHNDENERGSSHRQMIEADFEDILMRLCLDGLGALDTAAIARSHRCRWTA